jgi:hypothetical protein
VIHETKPGQTGHKEDSDKLPISLVPVEAINAFARVLRYGAVERVLPGGRKGYGVNNWRGGMPHTRIYDAAQRHLLAWLGGEDKDAESGLPHLWHALTCVGMLVWFTMHRPDLDDRWRPHDQQPTKRPPRRRA